MHRFIFIPTYTIRTTPAATICALVCIVCPFWRQYNFSETTKLCCYFSLFAVCGCCTLDGRAKTYVTKVARPRKKGALQPQPTNKLINLEVYYFTYPISLCGPKSSLREICCSHISNFLWQNLKLFRRHIIISSAPSSSSSPSSPHQQTTST